MAKRTEPTSALGKRLRLTYSMTARERRFWVTKLLAKQEALEAAELDLNKTIAQAWEAGASLAVIGGTMGLHQTTVKDRIDAVTKGDQGDSDASE